MEDNKKLSLIKKLASSKYLRRDPIDIGPREIIYWWELRRIPYNLTVGITGIISGMILLISLSLYSHFDPEVELMPDSPLFAAIGVLLYAIMANICYTGGWIAELVLYAFGRRSDPYFAPTSFVLGLAFSVLLTLMPAVFAVAMLISGFLKPAP